MIMTVGQLRAALAGFADDLPLTALVVDETTATDGRVAEHHVLELVFGTGKWPGQDRDVTRASLRLGELTGERYDEEPL